MSHIPDTDRAVKSLSRAFDGTSQPLSQGCGNLSSGTECQRSDDPEVARALLVSDAAVPRERRPAVHWDSLFRTTRTVCQTAPVYGL
eukprot:3181459-Rhodomonas_salina.3